MNQPPKHGPVPVPPPTGRIDIHCHLLPNVDDGCRDFRESIECVRRLQQAGFVGSICTPHVYAEGCVCDQFHHIDQWVAQLDQRLRDAGLDYCLWSGGELRLFDGVVDQLRQHGVPTLANSRCVLVDFWQPTWPIWATRALEWLLSENYQPILAHPERMACVETLSDNLERLDLMGIWLQGNFRPLTGQDGYKPDTWVRRLLAEGRYQFMAMDAHRPSSLDDRIDGMRLLEQEFGRQKLDQLTVDAPRRLILSSVH